MSTATATENGKPGTTQPEESIFPVGSFMEAAPFLRRPFTENAVKFKVQATWEGGGLIVSYIDARLVVERLNLVVPHLWFDNYEMLGKSLICRLTVDGITREDIGSDYVGKGLYSDALKRAAVKFGVGVSLYAIPQLRLSVDDGHLKVGKKPGQMFLTPSGETHCRKIYAAWLDTIGQKAFGEPLDHGDVEDAIGDAEEVAESVPSAEPTTKPKATAKAPEKSERPASAATRGKLNACFAAAELPAEAVKALTYWVSGAVIPDRVTQKQASALIEALGEDGEGSAELFAKLRNAADEGKELAVKAMALLGDGEAD